MSQERFDKGVVGLQQSDVDAYVLAEQASAILTPARGLRTAGRLFSYPETSIEAFANDQSMPAEEQDRIQAKADLPTGHSLFRYSKAGWREELVVMQRWHEVLKRYCFN